MNYNIEPIGVVHTPFQEKFSVPRQATLVPSLTCSIQLQGAMNTPDAVKGLDQYSHLWVLFLFDQHMDKTPSALVRPPRLGGNEKVGVLASRAPFRPNHIGMSAVALKGIRIEKEQVWIDIGCCDVVNKTPVVDIKPYIPYSDAIPDAIGGFAKQQPDIIKVVFSQQAKQQIQQRENANYLFQALTEILQQDPRPAYKKNKLDDKIYGVKLFDFDLRFQVTDNTLLVTQLND